VLIKDEHFLTCNKGCVVVVVVAVAAVAVIVDFFQFIKVQNNESKTLFPGIYFCYFLFSFYF